MPKIKIPKSSPSIDMTPMVDLAFLLVTFFMLSASFRSSEPVQVDTPASHSDKIIPENIIQVTVDTKGRAFFNMTGTEARVALLQEMANKYKVQFSKKQIEKFGFMTSFGCTIQELPKYIELPDEERGKRSTGIPLDSLNNQLKDWIFFGNRQSLTAGKNAYEIEKSKGNTPNINDFKPKFVLKVDGKAAYISAKNVIDVFRDLDLNNLSFVTSLEQEGKK